MADKIATRQAYGEALIELVEKNDKVVVLDADLANATQTCKVAKAHPEKFYNCGIAEANMVDIAAGMSTMGLIPYCSSFAMFAAGRAYEQIRNSIAYPHFNVKICATHAGVSVGEDGGSHQCIEDIALMRVIPGMTVICPADANEAKAATMAIAEMNGPVYMRLARLATPVFEGDMVKPFEIGKANVLREGKDVAIFATGLMVSESLAAAEKLAKEGIDVRLNTEGIDAAVINIHTIKPIDAECVTKYAVQCGKVITVEEHSVIGGLGDAVADVLMGKVNCKFHKIGVNDRFGQSGKAADVLREYGLTADQIAETVKANI
jgi:transketolase